MFGSEVQVTGETADRMRFDGQVPIPSTRDNTMVAVTAAFGIWALAAGPAVLPTALAHTLFKRNRLRRRAHEWKQLDKPPR
jgi:hypothetical protein